MSGPASSTVARVLTFAHYIQTAARTHGLKPTLLAGLIAQESAGNPYAVRVERPFWRRYGDRITAEIHASLSRRDDPWLRFPDLVSASYGLTQVLYPVALELGLPLDYPTELCDVALNLEAAGRLLDRDRLATGGDTEAMLLRYNGGGNPNYAALVLGWARLFPTTLDQPTPL